jgi:16S rRNA (guanine527-N7)-methyltransferase
MKLDECRKDDRQKGLALPPVSRETEERLDIYIRLLARWRKSTNLISDHALTSVWTRHVADSAQIKLINPRAIRWLDVGSGAGFPGIILAIQLASVKGAEVHCIESDQRKCAFLRDAARATCVPVTVHSIRIQSLRISAFGAIDGITARAFAPLSRTLEMARGWLEVGAVGIFPRGKTAVPQLQQDYLSSNYCIEVVPSVVEPSAAFLKVRIH